MEMLSGATSWLLLLMTGELQRALNLLGMDKQAWAYILLLAFTSAFGTYACTVTVRLFGPAVFTLLMTSRQVLSLVISVIVFQHTVDWLSCLCLVSVCLLILTASLRRASNELTTTAKAV